MANSYFTNIVSTGLVTVSTTVPSAGPYFIEGKTTLPTIVNGGGPSSLVTTISKNGTPFYTGLAGAQGFYTDVACAANDVIAIAFTSSAAADQALNAIKSTITIGQGE